MDNKRQKTANIWTRKHVALIVCKKIKTRNNKNYAEELAAALSEKFTIPIIIENGENIRSLLFEQEYDLVIASHTLPDMDAVSLFSALRSSEYYENAMFVLCTNKVTNAVQSICAANRIDAAYSFSTPADAIAADIISRYELHYTKVIKNRIKRIIEKLDTSMAFHEFGSGMSGLDYEINSLLKSLGFDLRLRGVEYIGLILKMRIGGMKEPLSMLYEYTAIYCGTTKSAVEKAVRYAIEQTWMKGNMYMQYHLFGNTTDEAKGKPTNAEFIATLHEHLKLMPCAGPIYLD